jgi:predicted acylesterase/phospholipase RssA
VDHYIAGILRTVTKNPLGIPYIPAPEATNEQTHFLIDQTHVLGTLLFGAPGFFKPRLFSPLLFRFSDPDTLSFCDVGALSSTLETFVDFDRINSADMRFSVGATNIRTGNLICFDNKTKIIRSAHVVASGSLPPGFTATEFDGEFYWYGGLVSNTSLPWVFDTRPQEDTLAFQIVLWSARGELPLGTHGVRNPRQFGLVVSAYAFSACLSALLAAGFADRLDANGYCYASIRALSSGRSGMDWLKASGPC